MQLQLLQFQRQIFASIFEVVEILSKTELIKLLKNNCFLLSYNRRPALFYSIKISKTHPLNLTWYRWFFVSLDRPTWCCAKEPIFKHTDQRQIILRGRGGKNLKLTSFVVGYSLSVHFFNLLCLSIRKL